MRSNGRVVCWIIASKPILSEVPGVENARSVSVGRPSYAVDHPAACAVIADGTVRCWGFDSIERIDPTKPLASATVVKGISGAVDVSVGNGYSCVLFADETVKCWGANLNGQLGSGQSHSALPDSSVPVAVVGLRGASTISTGSDLACATLTAGTAQCWGYLVIDGHFESHDSPIDIGLVGVSSVSAGAGHACARFRDGTVRCWGDITYGSGYSRGYSPTNPTDALIEPGEAQAVEVSAGYEHDCALGADGSIACWGRSERLGLGVDEIETGGYRYRTGPGSVVGITNAIAMSVGNYVTCAVQAEGSVWCWGQDWWGDPILGVPRQIDGL